VTEVSDGWPFLVARGRRAGYRTVLAPGFLVEADQHHVLAESAGTSGVGADGTRVVDVDDARVGPFSIGYASEQLVRTDVELVGSGGGDLLTDEHGRPLEIVYGIVSRDVLQAPLSVEDLRRARAQALQSYRRFLTDEEGHRVDTAVALSLRTRVRARSAGASTPAAAGKDAHGGPAAPELKHPRRRRPGLVAVGAAVIGGMLVAVGAVLLVAPGAQELTVYSSLPLQEPQRTTSQDIVRGIRLALKQADNKAGKFTVRYTSLDDSTAGALGWAREVVSRNALRAAKDDSTAVYIGELNSGASAVSIPILSRAKVPQISPANTAVGLTTAELGADEGEPGRYYVGGVRNYARIVPRDTFQGDALATVMRQDGCARVAIVHDRDRYGSGLARTIRRSIAKQRLRRVFDEPVRSRSAAYQRSLAARVAERRADCAVFSGDARSGAVGVFTALARALPRARLYGSDGLANRAFTDVDEGGLAQRVAARVKLTHPTVGRDRLGAAGRRFYADFAREYPGTGSPDPYAIDGYEAMSLALDAIERSRTGDREDIVKALFDTQARRSVIGTYSIDENGDTTLTDYGLYAIQDGAPLFKRTIAAMR